MIKFKNNIEQGLLKLTFHLAHFKGSDHFLILLGILVRYYDVKNQLDFFICVSSDAFLDFAKI